MIPPLENIVEGHVNIPWIPLTQAVGASLLLDLLSLCLPPHRMRLILHIVLLLNLDNTDNRYKKY